VALGVTSVPDIPDGTRTTEAGMPETTQTDAPAEFPADAADEAPAEALVEESLVEEVSIDGMCGVY
jgi:mycofactocin precursor